MKIAGLVKSSLIDYPGKIAAVVFTQGCNFRCGFCHNPDLIPINNQRSTINEKEVLEFLRTRVGKLDGVVVTGGEPLLQNDLVDFLTKVKTLGFAIKLDTNGSSPTKLSQLIDLKLINYIAMDIKGPLDKYGSICGYSNKKVIQDSVNIIMESSVTYEFRTTVLPAYHSVSDFHAVGRVIQNATRYTIQGFRPQITLDPNLASAKSFAVEQLVEIRDIVSPYVKEVLIHDNR